MIFKEFQKIPRLNRDCVITEKIDGTNAQIYIIKNEDIINDLSGLYTGYAELRIAKNDTYSMFAGSRTRWINPGDDNYGFAGWVQRNSEELFKLGQGQHFGEWWGQGIQRNYGLKEKRFSLFNTSRWINQSPVGYEPVYKDIKGNDAPNCISTVPVLYHGIFDNAKIQATLTLLGATGSIASPGFMNPEGIVVYHIASRNLYKVTLEKDNEPKSKGK